MASPPRQPIVLLVISCFLLQGNPEMREANKRIPTFLYAMPFSPTKVFLEETSLVARPAVGFQDLKDRLAARCDADSCRPVSFSSAPLALQAPWPFPEATASQSAFRTWRTSQQPGAALTGATWPFHTAFHDSASPALHDWAWSCGALHATCNWLLQDKPSLHLQKACGDHFFLMLCWPAAGPEHLRESPLRASLCVAFSPPVLTCASAPTATWSTWASASRTFEEPRLHHNLVAMAGLRASLQCRTAHWVTQHSQTLELNW